MSDSLQRVIVGMPVGNKNHHRHHRSYSCIQAGESSTIAGPTRRDRETAMEGRILRRLAQRNSGFRNGWGPRRLSRVLTASSGTKVIRWCEHAIFVSSGPHDPGGLGEAGSESQHVMRPTGSEIGHRPFPRKGHLYGEGTVLEKSQIEASA